MFAQLHPLIVHFPVALLVSGVVFEYYGTLQKEETALAAGHFNIRFGLVCALLAGLVGLAGLWGLELKEEARPFVGYHLMSAIATVLTFSAAIGISRWGRRKPWSRPAYLGLVLFGLACILSTGYFGGEMVHRFGVATLHPLE